MWYSFFSFFFSTKFNKFYFDFSTKIANSFCDENEDCMQFWMIQLKVFKMKKKIFNPEIQSKKFYLTPPKK